MDIRKFLTAGVAATASLAVSPANALTVKGEVVPEIKSFTVNPPVLPEFVLNAMWGTYGKRGVLHCNGTCPQHQLRWVRLVDCETSHLLAILATQPHITHTHYPSTIKLILVSRGFNETQIAEAIEAIHATQPY